MPASIGVIDLFAGPGGLGEGFASIVENSLHPFRIGISVEKEESAHRTLRLRAFVREYVGKHGNLPWEYIEFHSGARPDEPDWSEVDAEAWAEACREARCLTLGSVDAAQAIDEAIDRLKAENDETLLIGGPPCQAYSLVGRARSRGQTGYEPENDERHFLFREYIRVLDRLRPAAFVMENVKGMLSSSVQSRLVFEMLMEDLSSLGSRGRALYELRAVTIRDGRIRLVEAGRPGDFIVRAEQFGVPQNRHRVIIIGLRRNIAARASKVSVDAPSPGTATVMGAIGALASLRSGLTPARIDSPEHWRKAVLEAARELRQICNGSGHPHLAEAIETAAGKLRQTRLDDRADRTLPEGYGNSNDPLMSWIEHSELIAIAQHETRGHMESDLARYLFVAAFGSVEGRSPKASEFPVELAPKHRNWESGKFADRFRVQLADAPATTITSHISKDGHYFIHPDPAQCRSLTVREAARLQTFPDDYLFLGNRTQQYVQVGNAVPPYLARQIAQLLLRVLSGPDPVSDSSSEMAAASA